MNRYQSYLSAATLALLAGATPWTVDGRDLSASHEPTNTSDSLPSLEPRSPAAHVGQLTASDAAPSEGFGRYLRLSGDTAVVGAASGTYVFERIAGQWTEVVKLPVTGDVAISADTIVVGNAVFERDQGGPGAWGQVTTLAVAVTAVGIAGDTIVGGGWGLDEQVYVFERNAGGENHWGQTAQLNVEEDEELEHTLLQIEQVAAGLDGMSQRRTYIAFGRSVAISDNTIAVGAPFDEAGGYEAGAVYVFERSPTDPDQWVEVAKGIGGNYDELGLSVAIYGDTVAAAGPFDTDIGSVQVLERNSGDWARTTTLRPSDGFPSDFFGDDIAIADDMIVVGTAGAGAAYVFDRNHGGVANWGQSMRLLVVEEGIGLGRTVAAHGGTILLGAPQDDSGGGMRSGTVYVFDAACSERISLAADTWELISLPCNPGAADSVAEVFGDDLPGVYNEDWVIWERDEADDEYVRLSSSSALTAGTGYWIYSRDAAELEITGITHGEIDNALFGDPEGLRNLMGHPFQFSVCWRDVLVINGGEILTLDYADPGGVCDTDPSGCVMSQVMRKWNGNAYETFDGYTPGAEGVLNPFDGFWVKAFRPDLQLRIPAQPSVDCTGTAASRANTEQGGWHVRLTARADGMVDAANVFGQLPHSAEGYDRHDLIEPPPVGERYLTIVFPHADWGRRAGDYTTDFHALGSGSRHDRWSFEVWASQDVERVTLGWEGPEEILRRSFVVNELTGQQVPVSPEGSVTFAVRQGLGLFTWHVAGMKSVPAE